VEKTFLTKEILILAGGGGHTGYAYALAQVLHEKVHLSFLIPEGDTLSKERLKKFGEVDQLIKPRGPKTSTPKFAARLVKACVNSIKKVSRNLDFVVSTGSNFCLIPSFLAWIKGIPLINIESSVRFVKSSKTTHILEPFSTITALHWEEQKKLYKNGKIVGPLLPQPEVQPWEGGYILVTGGTYGHKQLFDVISESKIKNVVMQTGKIDPKPYVTSHPEWKIIPMSNKFYELVAGANIVVTHFGSTVLEALIYRKPTVIVPNPEWTRTAGIEDAKHLANKINAVLIKEIKLSRLLDAIDETRHKTSPIFQDGAQKLGELILDS
jgi:UDP-N-acetylglucosamine:LPS N-acetylglucosamine transferase